MTTFLVVMCSVLLLVCGVLVFLLVRFVRRTLQLDTLVSLLQDDMVANIKFFDDLLKKDLFMNTPEVVEANRKMNIMKLRLDEFLLQMKEQTGRE